MASEYLKKKYRDVKPDEKRELTPAEKRKNWWHYHKWHVLIGAVLVLFAVNLVWTTLGIGRVRPDYIFAYVGQYRLPDDTEAALETALAGLGEDLNGDGRTVAELRQYTAADGGATAYGMASQVQLIADINSQESYFFLMEDPVDFQRTYSILCYLDGSLPPENDTSAEGTYLTWADCPVLAGLDLGGYAYETADGELSGDSQALLSGLAIGRRGFWTDQTVPYPDGCAALWNAMTEGAVS